ncbi:MAG: hypothetical protein Q9161_005737 [Pseudevernia consocians]
METVKPASKALSDGSGDESLSPTYRHSWTMKQRLTLAMLAKSYSNNWNEKTAVFNHFHRSDLRRGGLRRVVVSAQFNDMRTWFNAANALKKLHKSLSPYDKLKLASQRGLEKKALDIGIQLIRNGPANSSIRSRMSDKHDAPGSKRKRVDPIDDVLPTDRSDNENQRASQPQTVHGLSILPKTPTKIMDKQPDNGLLTPPDSRQRKKQCLTADKNLAQLGFRAFTAQSQGTYCEVLGIRGIQEPEKLSYARHVMKKEAPPMTYSLGRAVGEMVGILRIPPKHFESGVWSLVQDYKPYNAEGARKRGHWSHNEAFKDGAVQGYQAITMASVEIEDNINAAKEIIDIDSGSDSYSNDENDPIPVEVEDWIRSTQASQASLQYFDLERNKWTIQEEELSDDFFAELRDMACNVNTKSPEMDGDRVNEDSMAVPQTRRQDESGNLPSDGAEMDTDVMTESGLAVRLRDSPKELEDLHELCADVLHMHRDEASSPELAAKKMVINYEFGWTGM